MRKGRSTARTACKEAILGREYSTAAMAAHVAEANLPMIPVSSHARHAMHPQQLLALALVLSRGLFGAELPPATITPATAAESKYHLTFDDEFNTYDGSRWQTADYWGMRNNAGDFQAQWFCDPLVVPMEARGKPYQPFLASGGTLKIVARPTPADTFSGPGTLPFVSGQLSSAHKFTQRYGYFELRAKLPPGKGLWSRFWLLTDDGNWPGEYDVFEVHGKDPKQVHQGTHFKTAQQPHDLEAGHYQGINPIDGKFHTYGFLWEKTGISWYVDGVLSLSQVNRIDIPMYVLIDLAVGNDPKNLWPGDPDATTPWPSTMELDYYRVYSNDPALPSATPDVGYAPSELPKGCSVESTSITGPLPPGWSARDIGRPVINGSSTWNPTTGEWIIKGSGNAGQSHFAGAPFPDNGSIAATIQAVTTIDRNDVRAGVAIRASENLDATEICLVSLAADRKTEPEPRLVMQVRGNHPPLEIASVVHHGTQVTVRLTRMGDLYTGAYSTDGGTTWLPVGEPQTIVMPGSALAGLVIGGNRNSDHRLARGIFTKVSLIQP